MNNTITPYAFSSTNQNGYRKSVLNVEFSTTTGRHDISLQACDDGISVLWYVDVHYIDDGDTELLYIRDFDGDTGTKGQLEATIDALTDFQDILQHVADHGELPGRVAGAK